MRDENHDDPAYGQQHCGGVTCDKLAMLTIAAIVAVEPSDENTPSGGHFYYRMRGFDEAGSSTYTNEVLVIVQN